LRELVDGGFLRSDEAAPFGGVGVAFSIGVDETRPQQIVARVVLTGGVALVQLADGSIKQSTLAEFVRKALENGYDSDGALDRARFSAPYVSDFLRLFPEAEVRHRNFDASFGFDLTVDLHERYDLTMQLPAVFDSARR